MTNLVECFGKIKKNNVDRKTLTKQCSHQFICSDEVSVNKSSRSESMLRCGEDVVNLKMFNYSFVNKSLKHLNNCTSEAYRTVIFCKVSSSLFIDRGYIRCFQIMQ